VFFFFFSCLDETAKNEKVFENDDACMWRLSRQLSAHAAQLTEEINGRGREEGREGGEKKMGARMGEEKG
jgi:hypothetical protein